MTFCRVCLAVHQAASQKCLYTAQTYEGIDKCGQRLAEEVKGYVEEHPALQRISVVGHSMGGLIARYALGNSSHLRLHACIG